MCSITRFYSRINKGFLAPQSCILYPRCMKVLILYKLKSEHARKVEEYVRDFNRNYPKHSLEIIDADSLDGTAKAELYDIMSYPAVVAIADDGSPLKTWQGEALPLMGEIAFYSGS